MLLKYRRYLLEERGLGTKTVTAREASARLFLAEHTGRELGALDGGDVARFVTRQCRHLKGGRSGESLVNGLRSFLRYALVEGMITAPLARAVPSVARWSGAGLPRGLANAEVSALWSLSASGRTRAVLSSSMDQPHLIEAMDGVLRKLGGTTRVWRTDRLATVIVPGTREVQATFAPVAKYYGAIVEPCPPRRGNRKALVAHCTSG